ncbi:hypothetical protein LVJ94_00105 [Pendulispora rubella]|uniref:VWFA domain-containing protein n=1 Tax=Pendulispora rubella TaxID=2741070 RepID=A0ABZ2L8Z1_9BACT
MSLSRGTALVWMGIAAVVLPACGGPLLAKDGTVIVGQKGAGGAAVVTPNGLEIHDNGDIPRRVVSRSPDDPWRAPIGFIVPRNGRFTLTSSPTLLATQGLGIAMRPSDTRVPAWGGEVLVRIDVIAPAAEGTARMGEQIALVLDGEGQDTRALVETALGQMASRDRFAVIDARGPRLVLPSIPGSHQAIGNAAVAKRLSSEGRERRPRDLAGALRLATAAVEGKGTKRVVVLSDGGDAPRLTDATRTELEKMVAGGVIVSAISSTEKAKTGVVADIGMAGMGFVGIDKALEARQNAVRTAIPPSGDLRFEELSLHFEGSPSPSHVIEASGGDVLWKLDAGEVILGNIRAGEARTEVLRVSVPAWVPNEPFYFTVIAHYKEPGTGNERDLTARLPCIYDDNIERIAKSRHGDVIAYASALATLRRLDSAFFGDGVTNAGGIRALAELHARSMTLLARDTKDPAIHEQADVLNSLLRVAE